MLDPAKVARIRRLAAKGYGTVVIAREVGVAPKTVRRYLESADADVQRRPNARRLSSQQLALVMETYRGEAQRSARLTAQIVAERGVQASVRTIQRAIAAARPQRKNRRPAISEPIAMPAESYSFTWAGKSGAERVARQPVTHVLRADQRHPRQRPDAELIEGDNLEAIKILRDERGAFAKLIYVDPPYGTGGRFTFDDRPATMRTTDRRDARHASWLSVLHSRLVVARELLLPNGVVVVSIDDRRVHHVRMLLDEICGEDNFVGCITVRTHPRGRGLRPHVATSHEFLVIYARDRGAEGLMRGTRLRLEDVPTRYPHVDGGGRYALHPLRGTDHRRRREDQSSMFFPLFVDPRTGRVATRRRRPFTVAVYPEAVREHGDGVWTWGSERADREAHLLLAKRRRGSRWRIYRKLYAEAEPTFSRATSIWTDGAFAYAAGKRAADAAVGRDVFAFAKSVDLLKRVVEIATRPNAADVVLDLFAGSGTLAEALAASNAADGGNRRVIALQQAEALDTRSTAYAAGYRTIADICRARMRRACASTKPRMSMRTYRLVPTK